MKKTHVIVTGTIIALGALNAQAQTDAEVLKRLDELQKLVETQNARIAQLETQNAKLSQVEAQGAKVAALEKKVDEQSAAVAKATAANPAGANIAKDGSKTPTLDLGKGVEKLTLTGYLQPQADHLTADYSGTISGKAGTSDTGEHMFIRRFVIGGKYDFGQGLNAQLLGNIANNGSSSTTKDQRDFNLERAVMEYTRDGNVFAFGYDKTPFGLEETTSASKIRAIERSAATRYFVEGGSGLSLGSQHTGVFAKGDLGGGFSYAASIANPEKGENDFSTPDTNTPGFNGRLDYSGKDGDFNWLVGVDAGYQSGGLEGAGGSDALGGGVHAQLGYGRFNLLGEVLAAKVGEGSLVKAGDDATPVGFTLQPSFFIVDKKLELVGRWSRVDSDGRGILTSDAIRRAPGSGYNFDTLDSLYLGLNWYIKGDTFKLMAGYEWARAEDPLKVASGIHGEETINGFRLRGQVSF